MQQKLNNIDDKSILKHTVRYHHITITPLHGVRSEKNQSQKGRLKVILRQVKEILNKSKRKQKWQNK